MSELNEGKQMSEEYQYTRKDVEAAIRAHPRLVSGFLPGALTRALVRYDIALRKVRAEAQGQEMDLRITFRKETDHLLVEDES